MRLPPRRRALLAVLASAALPWRGPGAAPRNPLWTLQDAQLRPGDLLFRRTVSLDGFGVHAIDAAGRFSHVGLVVGHAADGCAWVVHACPPERAGQAGVRYTQARSFVGGHDVLDAAAARLRARASQRQDMVEWARERVGWGFNDRFAWHAAHALYCTQLVDGAMRAAGITPLPIPRRWDTPLGELQVIPMSSVLNLPQLHMLPAVCHETAVPSLVPGGCAHGKAGDPILS